MGLLVPQRFVQLVHSVPKNGLGGVAQDPCSELANLKLAHFLLQVRHFLTQPFGQVLFCRDEFGEGGFILFIVFVDLVEFALFDNIDFAFLLVFELLFIGFGIGGILVDPLVFLEDSFVVELNHFLFGLSEFFHLFFIVLPLVGAEFSEGLFEFVFELFGIVLVEGQIGLVLLFPFVVGGLESGCVLLQFFHPGLEAFVQLR